MRFLGVFVALAAALSMVCAQSVITDTNACFSRVFPGRSSASRTTYSADQNALISGFDPTTYAAWPSSGNPAGLVTIMSGSTPALIDTNVAAFMLANNNSRLANISDFATVVGNTTDRCCRSLTCGYSFEPGHANTSLVMNYASTQIHFSGALFAFRLDNETDNAVRALAWAQNPSLGTRWGFEPISNMSIDVYSSGTWTSVASWNALDNTTTCDVVQVATASYVSYICSRYFAPTLGTAIRLVFDNTAMGGLAPGTPTSNGGWLTRFETYGNPPRSVYQGAAVQLSLFGQTLAGATGVATDTNFTVSFLAVTRDVLNRTLANGTSTFPDYATATSGLNVTVSDGATPVSFTVGDYNVAQSLVFSAIIPFNAATGMNGIAQAITIPASACTTASCAFTLTVSAPNCSPYTVTLPTVYRGIIPTSIGMLAAPGTVLSVPPSPGTAPGTAVTILAYNGTGVRVTANPTTILGLKYGTAVRRCVSYQPLYGATTSASILANCSNYLVDSLPLNVSGAIDFPAINLGITGPPSGLAAWPSGIYGFAIAIESATFSAYPISGAVGAYTLRHLVPASIACSASPSATFNYSTPTTNVTLNCSFADSAGATIPFGSQAATAASLKVTGAGSSNASYAVTAGNNFIFMEPLISASLANCGTGSCPFSVTVTGSNFFDVTGTAQVASAAIPLTIQNFPAPPIDTMKCTGPASPTLASPYTAAIVCTFVASVNNAVTGPAPWSIFINATTGSISATGSAAAGAMNVTISVPNIPISASTLTINIATNQSITVAPVAISFATLPGSYVFNPVSPATIKEYDPATTLTVRLTKFTTADVTVYAFLPPTLTFDPPGNTSMAFTFPAGSSPAPISGATFSFAVKATTRPITANSSYSTAIWFDVDSTDPQYVIEPDNLTITVTQPPIPVCGNLILDTFETCDDNNTAAGDGCGADCKAEAGWYCTTTPLPSVCTKLPLLKDVKPREIYAGATFTVVGENFGNTAAGVKLSFGTNDCLTSTLISNTSVVCTITKAIVVATGTTGADLALKLSIPSIPVPSAATNLGMTWYSLADIPCSPDCDYSQQCNRPAAGVGGTCGVWKCGNGALDTVNLLFGAETCDDNNTIAGDGCGADCKIETGFQCSKTLPSNCTRIPSPTPNVTATATPIASTPTPVATTTVPVFTTINDIPPISAIVALPVNTALQSQQITATSGGVSVFAVTFSPKFLSAGESINVAQVPITDPSIPQRNSWTDVPDGIGSKIVNVTFSKTTDFTASPCTLQFVVPPTVYSNYAQYELGYIDRTQSPAVWQPSGALTQGSTNFLTGTALHFTEYAVIKRIPQAVPSAAPATSTAPKKKGKPSWFIPVVAGSSAGGGLIIIIIVICCCMRKGKNAEEQPAAKGGKKGAMMAPPPPMPEPEPEIQHLEEVVVQAAPPPPPESDWIADITSFFSGLFATAPAPDGGAGGPAGAAAPMAAPAPPMAAPAAAAPPGVVTAV